MDGGKAPRLIIRHNGYEFYPQLLVRAPRWHQQQRGLVSQSVRVTARYVRLIGVRKRMAQCLD